MKITDIRTQRVLMGDGTAKNPRSAFVRIEVEGGQFGLGEVSPMHGGLASLGIVDRELRPPLIGADIFDHAVLVDTLFHRVIKLGPQGAATAALAAIDIALWDLKGKLLGLPVHTLLGGAWRKEFDFYASIGGNAKKTVDAVVRDVARRVENEAPVAVKIRLDGDRTRADADIAGDLEKARAVRKLLGDDFTIAFDANNAYSPGGALRVGHALADLGYSWFEEPVQHYDVRSMGELAQRLPITVSAGEQSYLLQELAMLIESGVRMIQPDIIKMGGITGMMRAAALAYAHGVEFCPHQTQPSIGHYANMSVLSATMHITRPVELADNWQRGFPVFLNAARPEGGKLRLAEGPGLGAVIDEAEWENRLERAD